MIDLGHNSHTGYWVDTYPKKVEGLSSSFNMASSVCRAVLRGYRHSPSCVLPKVGLKHMGRMFPLDSKPRIAPFSDFRLERRNGR